MRRNAGSYRDRDFRKGIAELARHRPDLAVRSLRAAVDACPAAKADELSRNLYWLALALLRLDRPELAVRSLASAQKLRPRGVARAAYAIRVNAYGMCRRPSPDLDDFYAFFSVQACAYLEGKKQGRFETTAEKDVVTRLIGDAWRSLAGSGSLKGLTAPRKLAVYRSWSIAFPFFGLERHVRGKVLDADFRRGGGLRGDERCSCGPGLPFIRCCGRVKAPSEQSCE